MSYTDPHWDRSALVTIDMQRDFTLEGAPAHVPGTAEVAPVVAGLAALYRTARLPIVHVVRAYRPDGGDVDLPRRQAIEEGARVVAPGSAGAELVDGLTPGGAAPIDWDRLVQVGLQELAPSEWVLWKPRWGAFYRTPLEAHLLGLGVDTLVLAGCNFPNCPRTTIYEASERDFRTVLAADACSQVYERGLGELAAIGVAVLPAAAIRQGLGGPPGGAG